MDEKIKGIYILPKDVEPSVIPPEELEQYNIENAKGKEAPRYVEHSITVKLPPTIFKLYDPETRQIVYENWKHERITEEEADKIMSDYYQRNKD